MSAHQDEQGFPITEVWQTLVSIIVVLFVTIGIPALVFYR
jgi:hypothetical protein